MWKDFPIWKQPTPLFSIIDVFRSVDDASQPVVVQATVTQFTPCYVPAEPEAGAGIAVGA